MAGRLFGLRPGGSIGQMPLDAADLETVATRLAEVAAGAEGGREDILRLRPVGSGHAVLVHLKAMGGGNRRHVLAVTSELAWSEAVPDFLARAFLLTPAEIEVMRLLVAFNFKSTVA